MAKCIIIVFDSPRYGTCLDDIRDVNISDIKEVCDFEDRWDVFEKYLKDKDKELSLCRDEEGLVYNDFNSDENYGIILKR